MDTGCNSLDDTDLHIEVSTSSGFKEDDHSPHSAASMDELMHYLDTLEEHANDSIKQSRASELYWLKTVQERDDVIRSNTKSIEDLQRLNDKLKEENEILREQLLLISENGDMVNGLTEDADSSRKLSLQLQTELTDQSDIAQKLREHNTALAQRLIQSGNDCKEIFRRLRQVRKSYQPGITNICKTIQSRGGKGRDQEEQDFLEKQLQDLCDLYDKIIDQASSEWDEHMKTAELMEKENLQHLRFEPPTAISSPRKSRPNSSFESERYYTDMLATLEKSNRELRHELEQLQKDLAAREQGMFNETLARMDNSNKDQMEKMKIQVSELSQELSLLNVDNRALRERLLRTENENEALQKKMGDSALVDREVRSLQENLDSQLGMNQVMDLKIKELELIKSEHISLCERTKEELLSAKQKVKECEKELSSLRSKLREAKDMQLKFDHMNHQLNNKMERIHTENILLIDDLSKAQKDVSSAHSTSAQELRMVDSLQTKIECLERVKEEHEQKIVELTNKLAETEKQKHNANLKVKALRERMKTLQDSWQKLSTDTESSFTALRDQYQQQIKEYKSIIDSLKSQNTSLTARIESMKKVNDQLNVGQNNQLAGLEQQISEYKEITEGYREENIVLRKELKALMESKDTSSSDMQVQTTPLSHQFMNKDEFAKLRDILTTAKTEVESMQHTKTPRNHSSVTEKESYLKEREQTRKTVQELRDKYEINSPVENKPASTEKSWKKYLMSSSNESLQVKPQVTESSPNASKARPLSSRVHTEKSQHTAPRPKTSQPSSTPRSYGNSVTTASSYTPITPFQLTDSKSSKSLSEQLSRSSSKFDKLGNIRPGLSTGEASTSIVDGKLKTSNPFNKLELAEASKEKAKYSTITTAAVVQAPKSKTKEVVEIKHRNSAELDLSKAFKPIDPDGGGLEESSYQSVYKPSYTSMYKSGYKLPSKYNSSTSNSDKTYKPHAYNTSTYKSTLDLVSDKPSTSYKSSMDSAYSSLTKSSLSATSLYTSPSYKKDTLPTIASIRSKYSSSEMLSKLVDHENKQTKRLNKKIDHIQTAVDHISLIAEVENKKLIRLLHDGMSTHREPQRSCEVYQPIKPFVFPQPTYVHLQTHNYRHLVPNSNF